MRLFLYCALISFSIAFGFTMIAIGIGYAVRLVGDWFASRAPSEDHEMLRDEPR